MLSDWKETCVKCMDGETEPHHCEYYGEPNGCNSPTYGKHPTCKESLEVGNAAALREALEEFVSVILDKKPGIHNLHRLAEKCRDAIAKPPRNCDVGTPQEQIKRWEEFCQEHHEHWKPGKSLTAIQRCNCPCHEGNGCNYFIWAQMPYEEMKE